MERGLMGMGMERGEIHGRTARLKDKDKDRDHKVLRVKVLDSG
jgi:hypothetical protein